MLKEHANIFRRLIIFFDLCIVAFAFYLGYYLRVKTHNVYFFSRYIVLIPVFVLVWGSSLYFFGMYRSFRIKRLIDILSIISKANFSGFIIFATFIYIFKLDISRFVIVFGFLFSSLSLIIEKIILICFFRYIRRRGLNFRRILIIGTGKRAQYFIDLINKHAEWGLKIIGLVDEDITKLGETISGYKVIGSFKDMPDIIHHNVIDEVVFVVPRSWLSKIEEIMHLCETEGLSIHIAVDYFELKFSKTKQSDLDGFPLLTFETVPDRIWHLLLKRLLDIVFSGAALLILAPIFGILALVIKRTSPGPALFRQERCGLNSRRFTLYKFRTMVEDAEVKLQEIRAHNEMNGPVFKITNDPRLTGVGKFLRRFSIDELPQLWNVFKGDMSLVGPRPPIPLEVEQYDSWQRRRLSMRPGITCLWQVNGRNKISDFNDWAKLDLEYIDNWSLWLDCKILFKTIPVVLFGIGAK